MTDKKKHTSTLHIIASPLATELMERLIARAVESGMMLCVCPCSRQFLTRTTDPLCPPCRQLSEANGEGN